MIFGFNTDISAMGKVYHVQTEVRAQAALVESQVFVKGQCLCKRATAIAAGASEQEVHELARMQHRGLVEAIRSGSMEQMEKPEAAETGADGGGHQGEAAPLKMELLGAQRVSAAEVALRFRLLCGGMAAAGAEFQARCSSASAAAQGATAADPGPAAAPVVASANGEGIAELRLALPEGGADLELRARYRGRQVARRFLLKPAIAQNPKAQNPKP